VNASATSRAPAGPCRPERGLFPYLLGAALVATFVLSWRAADVRPRLLVEGDGPRNMARFVVGAFPPALAPDFLGFLVRPFLETIWISVLGTAIAVAIGFPLALPATSSLGWSGILHATEAGRPWRRAARLLPYAAVRLVLGLFRSIPEYVWAFMFVRMVGLGPVAGILAIGVSYGGMLGKVYSEILEGVAERPIEALQATGAGRPAILVYGYLPQAVPQLVSYTLYRWECAIRASAILGFVGAGGLGQQIELAMRMFQFNEVVTLVGLLFVLVAAVDWLSAALRRRIV
jgi:phosphonate transport system permease protein